MFKNVTAYRIYTEILEITRSNFRKWLGRYKQAKFPITPSPILLGFWSISVCVLTIKVHNSILKKDICMIHYINVLIVYMV